jgi:hypothetical protein
LIRTIKPYLENFVHARLENSAHPRMALKGIVLQSEDDFLSRVVGISSYALARRLVSHRKPRGLCFRVCALLRRVSAAGR